jgi:hypothetical protein
MNISPLLLWKLTVAAATNSALLFKDEFGSRILLPKADHYLPNEHISKMQLLTDFHRESQSGAAISAAPPKRASSE